MSSSNMQPIISGATSLKGSSAAAAVVQAALRCRPMISWRWQETTVAHEMTIDLG
jgi:hypothetical protein